MKNSRHARTILIVAAIGSALVWPSGRAGTQDEPRWKRSPDIWEQPRRPGGRGIQTFEREQAENPPPAGAVLFAGSASIALWDLEKWFPEYQTIKRGFGGSMISESTHFADRVIIPNRPSTIVMYAGDNDIWLGKPPELTAQHFAEFAAKIRAALPDTQIVFISIRPSIDRWAVVDQFREANRLIQPIIAADPNLSYVDIDAPMIGPDGKPKPELFASDMLHNSEEGYRLWVSLLKPALARAAARYQEIQKVRARFVGNYKLIKYESFRDGQTREIDYSGVLMYDAHENMAAQGMPRDLPQREPEPGQRVARGGFAYFGKVVIDIDNAIVIHKVTGSPTRGSWVGEDNIRHFEFIGDDILALTIKRANGEKSGTLTWRRFQ